MEEQGKKTVVIGKRGNSFFETDLAEMVGVICRVAGFRVVGKTNDWRETVKMVEENNPDLVILGDYLPTRGDGARAAKVMRALSNPPHIIAFAYDNLEFGDTKIDQGHWSVQGFVKILLDLAE